VPADNSEKRINGGDKTAEEFRVTMLMTLAWSPLQPTNLGHGRQTRQPARSRVANIARHPEEGSQSCPFL